MPQHHLYLSLGSNLGDRKAMLDGALALINQRVGSVVRVSSYVETEPWGFESANRFLNAACLVHTSLSPMECLKRTQEIEQTMGRTTKSADGVYHDRPIDIDLLYYDQQEIDTPPLTLPHPHIAERDFVLVPLSEIMAPIPATANTQTPTNTHSPMTQDNQQEMLPLVDEQGNITGAATRGECHSGSKLLHPVVHLHVFNSHGDLYLQRRPMWKDIQPGKWDTAVGGHVDLGEDITKALMRETREELGITLPPMHALQSADAPSQATPTPLQHYVFESDVERELVFPFRYVTDQPITPSEETDGGRFWTREELLDAMGKGILTPNFESEYQRLFP